VFVSENFAFDPIDRFHFLGFIIDHAVHAIQNCGMIGKYERSET